MGSPISVVLAELTMQNLEKQIFDNSNVQLNLWKRYLDDIITILPEDEIENFLNFINALNPHFKFTCEVE